VSESVAVEVASPPGAGAGRETVCRVSPILVTRETAAVAKLGLGEAVTRAFATIFVKAETDFEERIEGDSPQSFGE
jgi:hypothetical protein